MTTSKGPASANPATARRKPGRPARPSADTDRTKEKLLDAATQLFARFGYDGVSTGDIAKAADFTQSMVHYHFGSKEHIWRAAMLRVMRRRGLLFAPLRIQRSNLNPLAKLELLIRNLAAANAAEPDWSRIIMQESITNSDRMQWLVQDFLQPALTVFDAVIVEAQEQGLIREMPVHDITNIVTSAVSLTYSLGPVVQKLYGVEPVSEDHLNSLSSSIIAILFDGLRVKGSG